MDMDDVTYCSNCGSDRCCPTCGKEAAREALAWAESQIMSCLHKPVASADRVMVRLWSKSQRRYATLVGAVIRDDTGLEHVVPLDDVEWVDAPTEEAFKKCAEAQTKKP